MHRIMGKDKRRDKGEGCKWFLKKIREKHKRSPPNKPSESEAARGNTSITPSNPPAQTEPCLGASDGSRLPEQSKQTPPQLGLWGKAADSLDRGDREKLDILNRSKRQASDGHVRDSLADEVNLVLATAEKLKEEDKEATWKPVGSLRPQSVRKTHAQQVDWF